VISHNVAVVSIEHVTTEFGETAFQLNEVIGGKLVAGSLLWSSVLPHYYFLRLYKPFRLEGRLTFVKTALGFKEYPPPPCPFDHPLPTNPPPCSYPPSPISHNRNTSPLVANNSPLPPPPSCGRESRGSQATFVAGTWILDDANKL
jgi:hypothetical protein